jgi:hypothetical protein
MFGTTVANFSMTLRDSALRCPLPVLRGRVRGVREGAILPENCPLPSPPLEYRERG